MSKKTYYERITQLKKSVKFRRTSEENCTNCKHYHYPENYNETKECRQDTQTIFSVAAEYTCDNWEGLL